MRCIRFTRRRGGVKKRIPKSAKRFLGKMRV